MAAIDFRDRLLAGLGGNWPQPGDLRPRVKKTIRKEGYRIESLKKCGAGRVPGLPGT